MKKVKFLMLSLLLVGSIISVFGQQKTKKIESAEDQRVEKTEIVVQYADKAEIEVLKQDITFLQEKIQNLEGNQGKGLSKKDLDSALKVNKKALESKMNSLKYSLAVISKEGKQTLEKANDAKLQADQAWTKADNLEEKIQKLQEQIDSLSTFDAEQKSINDRADDQNAENHKKYSNIYAFLYALCGILGISLVFIFANFFSIKRDKKSMEESIKKLKEE